MSNEQYANMLQIPDCCQTGKQLLSTLMVALFTDTYMCHSASMSYVSNYAIMQSFHQRLAVHRRHSASGTERLIASD